jgi:hypothetical protein
MDTEQDSKPQDGDRTPTKKSPQFAESLIDPALSSGSPDPDQEAAQRTARAATEVAERDVNVAWVEKVRLLENLRRLVSELLEEGQFDPEALTRSSSGSPAPSAMEGVETASTRASPAVAKEEPTKSEAEPVSYPTLRGLDEDGDAKMPSEE